MAEKNNTSEAAMKRSIARRFNDSLIGRMSRAATDKSLDRRTAKRLQRYREELKKGQKGKDKDLTALDIAMRINELLTHGDRLTDLRKLVKPRVVEYDEQLLVGVLKEMQPIYQYRPEAYRFAGVQNETLVAATILDHMPARRGPAPGSKPTAKSAAPKKAAKKKAAKPTEPPKTEKTTEKPKVAKKSTKPKAAKKAAKPKVAKKTGKPKAKAKAKAKAAK